MNFLGHAYLSGNDKELLYGNFIADAIKGSNYKTFPNGIKKGILTHRQIDDYIDHYPGFESFKKQLYPIAGKMTPVVIDIFVDHCLASNWSDFHELDLAKYTKWWHQSLESIGDFPPRIQLFYPYLKEGQWILNYAKPEGFSWALINVGRRIKFPIGMEAAVALCLQEKHNFQPIFYTFIENVTEHVQNYLSNFNS